MMSAAHNLSRSERIRNLVPLNTLAREHLEELLQKVSVEELNAGQFLFRAGDTDQQNVYLLSGTVGLLSNNREVDRIDSQSDLARYPLAQQFPRKLTARAASAVTALRVDNGLLSAYLSRSWTAGYKVEELRQPDPTESDDWMTQLLGSRMLRLMPNARIPQVLQHVTKRDVKAGEVIFNQGDPGTDYYFIHRGNCQLIRVEEGGAGPREVAELGPGDSFGEDALLSGSPRSCTIAMLTDGQLLCLSKTDFVQLIKRPLCRDIAYAQAKSQVHAGAVWLDVRPRRARETGFLVGSIHLPFDLIRYQMSNLDNARDYIVYCEDGSTSTAAAYLLTERGFRVAVLTRGVRAVPGAELVRESTTSTRHPKLADSEPPVAEQDLPQQRASDASAETRPLERISRLEQELARAHARIAELEGLQDGHDELDKARAQIAQLERCQARIDDLEFAHAQELVRLKGALAGAQALLARQSSTDSQGRENEILKLRQALKAAAANVNELTREIDAMEQRHMSETEELQALWERRVQTLENRLGEQRARLRGKGLEKKAERPAPREPA